MVLGTVTGPPPPTWIADPEDVETGFPGPCVRWSRTSSVPVLAVVTKPPMLGLEMFHSEKVIGISANTSIADPVRSAVTGKVTDFVTPNWFGHQHAQSQIDLERHASSAFQVLSGGYAQQFQTGKGWVQVTGAKAQRSARGASAAEGSRRERRARQAREPLRCSQRRW